MKKIMFLPLLIGLLAMPLVSYAETVQKCVLQEKSGFNNFKLYAATDMTKYQPCYVGGKVVKYCPQLLPYYNVFSDECYSSLENCKKADGDLSNASGNGGCTRCSR